MSIRVSLRGMLRLIRVDTLRRVHHVGFLAGTTHTYDVNISAKENCICRLFQTCLRGEVVRASVPGAG